MSTLDQFLIFYAAPLTFFAGVIATFVWAFFMNPDDI
ncbi:cytochrome bd oxidase small subunit CydS [Exiguobacterium marinum]